MLRSVLLRGRAALYWAAIRGHSVWELLQPAPFNRPSSWEKEGVSGGEHLINKARNVNLNTQTAESAGIKLQMVLLLLGEKQTKRYYGSIISNDFKRKSI